MRTLLGVLCLWALAGPSRVEAETSVALIWKGSKDKAQAEALEPAWSGVGEFLEKTGLTLPEGYPKLVKSNTLPGLKSGFWVWLLGTCSAEDAKPLLDQVKVLAPDTYSREVKVPAKKRACPTKEGPALEAREEKLDLAEGRTLRVFTHEESETPEGDEPGDSFTRTRYYFVLMSKKGEVLDSHDVVGEEDFTGDVRQGPQAYQCTVSGIESSGKDTLVMSRNCGAGAGECGALLSADEITTVKAGAASVSGSTKRENEQYAECD